MTTIITPKTVITAAQTRAINSMNDLMIKPIILDIVLSIRLWKKVWNVEVVVICFQGANQVLRRLLTAKVLPTWLISVPILPKAQAQPLPYHQPSIKRIAMLPL